MVFTFNKNLPDEWVNMIVHGSYSHSCVLGYDHDKLQKVTNNVLHMRLRGTESEGTIKNIVTDIKDWVETINGEYSGSIKRRIADEYRRKEAERIAKIERIEREKEKSLKINSMLSELI